MINCHIHLSHFNLLVYMKMKLLMRNNNSNLLSDTDSPDARLEYPREGTRKSRLWTKSTMNVDPSRRGNNLKQLLTGAERREFSGMIPVITSNNHPSNPQQPIHSLCKTHQ